MASFLSKLFKPKWQNSSKSVRLEAIESFAPDSIEQQQILVELLLNDSSEDVRAAALAKIGDPNSLIKHYPSIDKSLKTEALKRISELSQQLGLSLYDMVEDTQLLAQMILASDEQSEFMNGLARLQNEEALLLIAQQAQLSKVRQAATELIETEESLNTLAQTAKSKDKKVFQMAKSKLTAIRAHQKQQQDKQVQVQAVLASLQELAQTDDSSLYAAKIDNLEQRWKELSETINAEQLVRYQTLRSECFEKRDSFAQQETQGNTPASQQSEAQPQAETPSVEDEELQATISTLEDTASQLQSRPASTQELSAIDAIIKTQETRWIESSKDCTVSKQSEKRYSALMAQLRTYLSALRKFGQHETNLQQLCASSADKQDREESARKLIKLNQAIAWPSQFHQPELLTQVNAVIEQSQANAQQNTEKQNALIEKFNEQLSALDASLDEKQLGDSKKQMHELRQTYNTFDKKRQHQFNAAIKLRSNQLDELRDWQGFAASPRQQALCEEMEQLVEQHIAPQDKADKIKALQNEWKRLGGSRDQSLWDRFSKAADLAFEPCSSFFNEQGQLKQSNLEKRKTLLEELSNFVEQNDWNNADWKAVEKINRQARNEWRDAYPVDHRAGRKLQQTFNEVLAKLDSKLELERNNNLKAKEDVVAQAQALASSFASSNEAAADKPDIQSAMQAAKDLQKTWQEIGITEHKKDRALWKAFRKACDEIFEQRDNERKQAKEAINQKLDEAKAQLEAAKGIATKHYSDITELDAALAEIRASLKVINAAPNKAKSKLLDEHTQYVEALKTQRKALMFGETKKQWDEAARKSSLLAELTALDTQQEGASNDLKEAFISRVKLNKALEESFQSAWKAIVSNKGLEVLSDDATQELCIRCEIAAGLDSPDSDQERRMQLQVSRLSEGLSRNVHQTREAQLEELLIKWFAGALVSSENKSTYATRIDTCISKVFEPSSTQAGIKSKTTESA